MPTVRYPTRRIIQLSGWNGTLEHLAERIAMLGTDVEHVTEDEILVEIFPNRPDLLSHTLFAKALRDFTSTPRYDDVQAEPSDHTIIIDPRMRDVRPYTLAAIIEDLTLSEEDLQLIIQLQEKLDMTHHRNRKKAAAGIYPLEQITWPIRFTTINPDETRFTPLGMSTPIIARELIHQHPKGKAYGHLLQGMHAWPAFIDAEGRILSIPPIVNSEDTGRVTTRTRSVFIEVSGSHLPTIRTSLAILTMTLQLLGGRAKRVIIHYPDDYPLVSGRVESPLEEPRTVRLTPRDASQLIGVKLSEEALGDALRRMGHAYEQGIVTVPSYRADILHPIDVIEDVTISLGYENLPAVLPRLEGSGDTHPVEDEKQHVLSILAELGYHELPLLHLTNAAEEKRILGAWRKQIRLENPLNAQYDSIRTSILYPLLEAAVENKQERYPHKLMHLGRIAYREDTQIIEEDELGILHATPTASYTDLRAVLETLFNRLGLHDQITHEPILQASKPHVYWPGRSSRILLNGRLARFILTRSASSASQRPSS